MIVILDFWDFQTLSLKVEDCNEKGILSSFIDQYIKEWSGGLHIEKAGYS